MKKNRNSSVLGIQNIRNLISLPSVYFFLLKNVLNQKRFIKNVIENELTAFKSNNDGSLTPEDFKKITRYYGLGVPGILGELFCLLRGKKMAKDERFCLTFLGGISGLLDDLFDDPKKQAGHLEEFILEPESLKPMNSYEALLLHFYLLGLKHSANPELLKNQALQVYKSQQESENQQNFGNSTQEIQDITYAKGGASFIFYRLCLNNPLQGKERELLTHLGGLMQLGNDIFDVWEDYYSQTKTAATLCSDISELRNKFKNEIYLIFKLARETDFPKKRVEVFLQNTALALSRVLVCLDQFEKLQKTTGNQFTIEKYSREELICDMQKAKNQLKAIKYALNLFPQKY